MKKYIIIGACVVFAVALFFFGSKVLAPTQPPANLPESTAPHHYTIHDTDKALPYIITVPKDAKENMPLVVYLHDEKGKGSNPAKLTEEPGFTRSHILGELEKIPGYVLIPQLKNETGWEHMKAELIALIDKVAKEYKINTAKISLTGYGMGGTGALKLAATYPEKFSCVVSIGGFIAQFPANLEALKDMPIRSYTCDSDLNVPCIETLSQTNKNCSAIALGNLDPNATWMIYKSSKYGILKWMLAQ